jgi:DivIVA domain-containing protein
VAGRTLVLSAVGAEARFDAVVGLRAVPGELPITITSAPRLTPEQVTAREFRVVRKGLDPMAVRAHLELVAKELAAVLEREAVLLRALEDAEARLKNPELDEATLVDALGREAAQILKAARQAASELTERCRTEAEALVAEAREAALALREEARKEADRTQAEAARARERLLAEAAERAAAVEAEAAERATAVQADADAYAERTRAKAAEEAERVVATARAQAEALVNEARAQGRAILQEAQQLRARVLHDLTRRRRMLEAEVSRLAEARNQLAAVIGRARRSVAEIDEQLGLPGAAGRSVPDEEQPAKESATQGTTAVLVDAAMSPKEATSPVDGPPTAERTTEASADAQAAHADEPPTREPSDAQSSHPAEEASVIEAEEPLDDAPVIDTEAVPKEASGAERTRQRRGEVVVLEQAGSVHALVARLRAQAVEPGSLGSQGEVRQQRPEDAPQEPDERIAPARADGTGHEVRHADAEALARRDALLAPVAASLARRLKRVLQDDQNELLARLRRAKTVGPELLVDQAEQDRRVLEAVGAELGRARSLASKLVGVVNAAANAAADNAAPAEATTSETAETATSEAANATTSDATEATTSEAAQDAASSASRGGHSGEHGPWRQALAREIATVLYSPLRRRLEALLERGPGSDPAALASELGAAYRDAKAGRLERIAWDYAVAAFGDGVLALVAPGTPVRWVVDDGNGSHCPDCDDNALAGPLEAGASFPTGHARPPAHAGCRCLILVAD